MAAQTDAFHGYRGYRGYIVEPGRLVPNVPGSLRPECTVNCLAVKGPLPPLDGWQVGAPRSREETIHKIILAARSPRAHDRANLGRILATAAADLLPDRRVQRVLALLRYDPDETVRAESAWFTTTDQPADGLP